MADLESLSIAGTDSDSGGEDQEPADLTKLDYAISLPCERIANAAKEKEAGNKLFAVGEYEKAWKQYDKAFVHVYTSKEEWEAIGVSGRHEINSFKMPCHLNRGLCRLKRGDYDNALWDFSEALRITPDFPKGLYRRGLALMGLVRQEMKKEEEHECWDLEKAELRVADAKKDLMKAARAVPTDRSIRDALDDLKKIQAELREHRRKYTSEQKALYSSFISNLDKDNARLQEAEDQGLLQDLPPLERVRIA